jgi:hypothetical protein
VFLGSLRSGSSFGRGQTHPIVIRLIELAIQGIRATAAHGQQDASSVQGLSPFLFRPEFAVPPTAPGIE